VRYAEVDMQGIVFNASYLTYFDTAISEYMRDLGYDLFDHVDETGTDFHTVKVLVEYLAPIRADDEIEVFVRVDRVGRSSLTFLLEIHPAGVERILTTGEVVWVNADQSSHASAALPDAFVERLEAREGTVLRS